MMVWFYAWVSFCYRSSCLKDTHFKSGQKWSKNNHLASITKVQQSLKHSVQSTIPFLLPKMLKSPKHSLRTPKFIGIKECNQLSWSIWPECRVTLKWSPWLLLRHVPREINCIFTSFDYFICFCSCCCLH